MPIPTTIELSESESNIGKGAISMVGDLIEPFALQEKYSTR